MANFTEFDEKSIIEFERCSPPQNDNRSLSSVLPARTASSARHGEGCAGRDSLPARSGELRAELERGLLRDSPGAWWTRDGRVDL